MSEQNSFPRVAVLAVAPIVGGILGYFIGIGGGDVSASSYFGIKNLINAFGGVFLGALAGLITGIIYFVSTQHRTNLNEKTIEEPQSQQSHNETETIQETVTMEQTEPAIHGRPPKNWLVESILVTLFCCVPFGIVAIIYASKVNGLYHGGAHTEALKASDRAKTWVLWSFGVGLFLGLIWFGVGFFDVLF
jgi:hypothetical protein